MKCKLCPYKKFCHSSGDCENCDFGKAFEKLNKKLKNTKAENEKLKAEVERLKNTHIELPCKVGDTVYMPWEWNGQKGVACLTVTTISNILGFGWSCGTNFDTDDEGYADKYNCGRFKFDDIGETVFLTKEEAEKALAERKDV